MKVTSGDRVQKYRERLKAQGLKPVQIWVPDSGRPGFAEECRRQSLALKDDPAEADQLQWIEEVADRADWE